MSSIQSKHSTLGDGETIAIELDPAILHRLFARHQLSVEELRPSTPQAKRQVKQLLLKHLG